VSVWYTLAYSDRVDNTQKSFNIDLLQNSNISYDEIFDKDSAIKQLVSMP